jgi:hypothetical protein
MQTFLAVAEVVAGEYGSARRHVDALEADVSEDGYDCFILNWAGWLRGLAELDAPEARRWIARQHDYLDRTGIVETWITTFSTALVEVVEGADVRPRLDRALALADREGHDADADCLLALAYSEVCAQRFEAAAELIGTALQTGFNATAHFVLYRAVIDNALRRALAPDVLDGALARGRGRVAADAIASYGLTRPPR